jgi:hypothetical protein
MININFVSVNNENPERLTFVEKEASTGGTKCLEKIPKEKMSLIKWSKIERDQGLGAMLRLD